MFPSPEDLNAEQRAAVEHGRGPLLVLAGAGTGKTGVLAFRVAHLIASGAEPSRICLLTFTRRAAQEMLARAGRLTGRTASGRVWGGTFHSVANRVLRLHGRRVGLDPAFTVMDQGDTAELLGLVRHDLLSGGAPLGPSGPLGDAGRLGNPERLGDPVRIEDANRFGHADRFGDADRLAEARAPAHPAGAGRRFPRAETLAAIYSRTVNTQQRLATVLSRDFPWCHDAAEGIRGNYEAYT